MKQNPLVSSSRRKSRKAHFSSTSMEKRLRMSCALQKDLKSKFSVNSIPIKRDDEVKIMRGSFKGREGKVLSVYRRRWCIYIDKIVKDKVNGQQVQIPIDPSNCVITKIKMDKDRKELLERKKLVKKDL